MLLGHPVAHSLSPRFQQAALDAVGIPLRYETLDVPPDALEPTLSALREAGAAGNVTVPHKLAVAARCDVLSPLAERTGAVNVFWTSADRRLHGDNTDVGGFDMAARALLAARTGAEPSAGDAPRGAGGSGPRVLVLGAGGAALAVREAVASWPNATLTVVARDATRAAAFARPLGPRAVVLPWDDTLAVHGAAAQADLVVNTTPLGLHRSDALPLDVAQVGAQTAVLDLTYRADGPTAWVAAARARGLRADDGLGMLLEQGALAFERWFGMPAPRDVMWRALGR